MEEYNDIVVKKLIELIESGSDIGICHLATKEIVDTKLLELFDENQRIRTIKDNWCTYYVVLENNLLLSISFNNCDKLDNRPTKFMFSLHPEADKSYVRFQPIPGAYSNFMQVINYRGHEIDDVKNMSNKEYITSGSDCLDLEMSEVGQEYFTNLIEPTSIEQIKERARKSRTK